MSKMTFSCYLRLHVKQLNNVEYAKGYEYAKRRLINFFKTMDLKTLFESLRSWIDISIKTKNYYALGQAQVIRELIWERIEGDGLVA